MTTRLRTWFSWVVGYASHLDLKTASSRLRTLLVASDPSFARLRMASRVTLTLIAVVGVLFLVHTFLPLSVAAYGIAVITATDV